MEPKTAAVPSWSRGRGGFEEFRTAPPASKAPKVKPAAKLGIDCALTYPEDKLSTSQSKHRKKIRKKTNLPKIPPPATRAEYANPM